MAEVIPTPSSNVGFDLSASPMDSPTETTSTSFVDASEYPFPIVLTTTSERQFSGSADARPLGLSIPSETGSGLDSNHRKHKSLALPEFSFNPGVNAQTNTIGISPPVSPLNSSVHSSPSRARAGHRRIRSELTGGDSNHPSPISVGVNPFDRVDEELKGKTSNDTAATQPPRGHRHRRSAAVSKDLTSVIGRPSSAHMRVGSIQAEAISPSSPFELATAQSAPERASEALPIPSFDSSLATDVEIGPRRSLPSLKASRPTLSQPTIYSSDGVAAHTFCSDDLTASPDMNPSTQPDLDHDFSEPAPIPDIDLQSTESLVSSGDFPSVSIVEQAEDGDVFLGFSETHGVTLCEDFDGDPTSAIEVPQRRPTSLPPSPRSPSATFEASASGSNIIDLDTANDITVAAPMTAEEARSLRGTGFSAARRRMHSGGMDNVAVGPGLPTHRRTESAPSLAAPFFDRPPVPRLGSEAPDTASEKGFKIENVFEEDEEDAEAAHEEERRFRDQARRKSEQLGFGLGIEASSVSADESEATQLGRSGTIIRADSDGHETPTPTNETDIPSRSQTIRQPSSNRQSLILAEEPAQETLDRHEWLRSYTDPAFEAAPSDISSRPDSQPSSSLNVPSWASQHDAGSLISTPHDRSHSSAWSTPKLDTAATSVSDAPQTSLPRIQADSYTTSSVSTDGIPSLVSSHSTASGFHHYGGSSASPSTPIGSVSRHSNMSMGSQAERRRKRSSIVSLSHLMSLSRSTGGRSNLSVEQDIRCQTSSGLSIPANASVSTPAKEKRLKRLSRAVKFWKSKDEPNG